MRRGVASRALLAGGLIVTGIHATAPSAQGGQYAVDFCKRWDTDAPTRVFDGLQNIGAIGISADCQIGGPAGGVHQLHEGGRMGHDVDAWLQLTVPADRPAINIERAWTEHRLAANSGSIAFLRFSSGTTIIDNEQAPQNRKDDRSLPGGTRQLRWTIYCSFSQGPVGCQWPSPSDVLHISKARLFLDESAPPELTITGGSLLGGGPRSGAGTVTLDAGDADSGVAALSVKVGDSTVGSAALPCPHDDWSACPRSRSGQTLTADLTRIPNGTHPVTVAARDAAGNTTLRSAGTVSVANGVATVPGGPNGARASRAAKLTVRHAGSRPRKTRRVRYGSRPTVRARLTNEQGQPISGAKLVVLSRERRDDAPRTAIATVTTDADGAASHKLPPGPSRTITFSYTAFGSEPPARLRSVFSSVRASVAAARISPRRPRAGGLARFTGRLRYLPRRRVQILIQARDGRRWRTIGQTQTRTGGRFTWRYRFKRSSIGTRFVLRARVKSPNYPFSTGYSPRLAVRVRR